MRAYPAPARLDWAVMVQLSSGEQIVGTDDEDVFDRWRRLHWASPAMDRTEFKDKILGFCRAVYSCGLIGITGDSPAELILDALTAEGVLEVIRK